MFPRASLTRIPSDTNGAIKGHRNWGAHMECFRGIDSGGESINDNRQAR